MFAAAAVSGRNNTVKLVMEQDDFVEVVGTFIPFRRS
jgi:hypothetical protein